MVTVVAAVIFREGRLLAARKKEGLPLAGSWEFPGGKVDPGETPEQGLKRELAEELGIDCTVREFFCESVHHYDDCSVRLLGYRVETLAERFVLTDHDAIRWLEYAEIEDLDWAPADIPLAEAGAAYLATDRTLAYYNREAEAYIRETAGLDMTPHLERFARLIPPGGHILDLGCGSGRDSRWFLDNGFTVTAMEPSPEIARRASRYLDREVKTECAQQLTAHDDYDGIWACASLLHIPTSQMPDTLGRIAAALKPGGTLYISIRNGESGIWDQRGRYITPIPFSRFSSMVTAVPGLTITTSYESHSVAAGGHDTWLNLLVQKCDDVYQKITIKALER